MAVNTISDLVQILQQYWANHQAIHQSEPDRPYVFDEKAATISAFEPVKVNVSFVSEGAGYSNLSGAILLGDLLKADQNAEVTSLFEDGNNNQLIDGAEKGLIEPFFVDKYNIDINGTWLDEGNFSTEEERELRATSVTLLPGDVMTNYLLTGYGHVPSRRRDYLISIPEAGSLKTGQLPPEGSYVKVTQNNDGTYTVAWEDLTGGGDRDFDDVVLKFEIEKIPVYRSAGSAVIPDTATAHNTYAFQVGNAVIEAWYEYDPATDKPTKLWFKTTALADLPEGYKFKLTGPNGEELPNVGNNPFTLRTLKEGETDIQYFAPVTGPAKLTVTSPAIATIEKRATVGYSTKTITFGDEASTTIKIPVLDITQKVNLNFGKYERLMPNGTSVIATVPATAESQEVSPTAQPTTETINIENPGKPVKPNKADFYDEAGNFDKEAYKAALAEYKEALAAYKSALKTYKAAVKAVKLEAKGQVKSLKVEQKAIKLVNRALSKLVKGERKADKFVTKAEVSLEKAANFRTLAEQLRAEANEKATALLGEDWTMEDLENALVKPKKSDFIDETGELDKEAYQAALARYKEAKAISKLFKKSDKYELKATKLETKAEIYQKKAVDITAKTVDKFESTLEKLVAKYTAKAESLRAKGESLLAQAENLSGANYYKALGKGLYSVELAEGYARGVEIATAVLETYVNLDVIANPDVADTLENVDLSNINVSI